MRTRPLALATIPALVGIVIACSQPQRPDCPHGSFPMPGATGVPTDVEIVLNTSWLPRDVPSLSEAVGLETSGGRPVPIEVTIEGDEIHIQPLQPLKAEETYLVWGISVGEERWWDEIVDDYAEITFTTGGTPQLLASMRGYDEDTLWLAFSEPVDLASLDGALLFPEDQPYTVVGYVEEAETIVEIAVDLAQSGTDLSLADGVESLRGPSVQLAIDEDLRLGMDAPDLHDLHAHRPYCATDWRD